MKILMVGPHKDKVKGGMSTVIKNYYNSELLSKYDFITISTVVDGCKLMKLLCFINSFTKMVYCLMFKNIDIVHVHVASRTSFYRKSFFIRLANLFKKKIVIHMHGGEFDVFYWQECNENQRKKISKILNMSNKIIALGKEWENRISRYCSVDVTVVYNSVDVEKQNSYNINSKNILFLGRLETEKGIFDLIKAAQYVLKEQSDINFVLAGIGDLSKVIKMIKDEKLENNFKLLGWVDSNEVKNLLRDTMIYVLPSYNEGMPMSILEAMSYGVPIISTNVGSIPEIIKNMVNGFLIKPGDVRALVNSILYLNKNLDSKKEISINNFNDVNRKYSNDVNYNILSNIYEELSLYGEKEKVI